MPSCTFDRRHNAGYGHGSRTVQILTESFLIPGLVLSSLSGCDRKQSSTRSDEDLHAGPDRCVVVFVNNWTISSSHGCYSQTSPAQVAEQILTCGPNGKESRLRFKWVPSDDVVDHYLLNWETAEGLTVADQQPPGSNSIQKEVAFYGETLVVFENDLQRVILYPCDVDHPPRVDASTRRSP